MTPFFKKTYLKFKPETTSRICPHCDAATSLISIVSDYYKCTNCGEEVKQEINGVIKYLPLGSEVIEEEHGT